MKAMNKMHSVLNSIDEVQVRYKMSQFAAGLGQANQAPPPPLRGNIVIVEGKITEKELKRLHDLIETKSSRKDDYLDFLYEEYGISRDTHRIALRDGTINRLNNG